ncbi:hypothetical protein [Nocardiopsis coralliicola]
MVPSPLTAPRPLRRFLTALACAGALTAASACGPIPAPVREGPPPDGRGAASEEPGTSEEPEEEQSPSEPEKDYRTGAVPSAEPEFDESQLGRAPSGGDFSAAVEWEINRFVNMFSLEYDPDSSVSCEAIEPVKDTEATCDSVYNDYSSEFTVTVTDDEGSVEYETGRLPVSRDAVEERFRFHADEGEVLCDMSRYQLVSASDKIDCESAGGVRSRVEVASDGSGVTFNDR